MCLNSDAKKASTGESENMNCGRGSGWELISARFCVFSSLICKKKKHKWYLWQLAADCNVYMGAAV
jgi:hypothetical protein